MLIPLFVAETLICLGGIYIFTFVTFFLHLLGPTYLLRVTCISYEVLTLH